jgi:hypothetical protein
MISVALASGIPVVDEFRELVTISEGASTENRTHEIGFEHFAGSLDTTAHHTRDSRATRRTRAAQKEALDFRAGTHAHRTRLSARHFDSVGRTARRAREAFLADWAGRFLPFDVFAQVGDDLLRSIDELFDEIGLALSRNEVSMPRSRLGCDIRTYRWC